MSSKGGYQRRRIQTKKMQEKIARRRARRRKLLLTWLVGLMLTGLVVTVVLVATSGNKAKPLANPSGTASPGTSASASPTTPGPCTTPVPELQGKKTFSNPPCMIIDAGKKYTATMKTNLGTMKLVLDPSVAPKTVNNFVFLAQVGFYNGTTFHRVIPGFMIQGGDPAGNGSGGPGYQFPDENVTSQFTKPGIIAMANSGPGTNGSQFFITAAKVDHLNAKGKCPAPQGCHSIFGEVTEGMDVLNKIINEPRDAQDKPKTPVVIESVTIASS